MADDLTSLGLIRGRFGKALLSAVAASGAGSAYSDFSAMYKKTFQCYGTFVATVAVQGSNDNTNWVTIATFTGPDVSTHESCFQYLRGNVTSFTSGSITLRVDGITE